MLLGSSSSVLDQFLSQAESQFQSWSTMYLIRFLLVLVLVLVPLGSSDPVLEPYDLLFDVAVEAYSRADWLSVVLHMEKALRNKALIRTVKADCRLRCSNQSSFSQPVAGVGDLGFFQKVLHRADCVKSCENHKLGEPSFHRGTEEVDLEFKKRTPYNYLQVAYFKINKLDKAVAAANTFYQANPDHMEMKQNLDYYRMMAGVQEEDFKDLEAREHMADFLLGKSYYSDASFGLAARHFEEALVEYFNADKECRALCEGAYDYDGYNYMEYHADLFQSITDHYLQVLNCKQRCSVELASSAGKDTPFEDFLPSHFNYLQFSYYNSEKYEQAIQCAKTFLLFHPEEQVMTQNLNYYSVVLGEDKAATIAPRQEVKQYIQQSLLEKELLYFGYEAFGITFVDPVSEEDFPPLQLNGSQRVLLDGVINDDQCRELQRLSNAAAGKGDGYRGGVSPHSPSETFQGVTVLKAVKLGQEGAVPLQSSRLFFDVSEKVRKVLESYFLLDTSLYFSYSHLVCRSAIDEKQDQCSDLSHPVHVDNCLLVSELNECIKEPPAYTHRDYSAILYLNDDFEGGELIFTELDARTVTAEVRPRCGRVLGFGSGKENPHGVKAVTQGQRCAVALWFTLDPLHQEKVGSYICSSNHPSIHPFIHPFIHPHALYDSAPPTGCYRLLPWCCVLVMDHLSLYMFCSVGEDPG
uniref:procollagen-proline 3-dioxygenase n=1 Tax=Gouania willdenowi TaxID=441366 RepID=A0A8C5DXE2_GOUWI